MKHIILGITLMTALLQAAPAFQHSRTFAQPDGSRFSGTVKGDEYLNWIESEVGDIVVFNKATRRYEAAAVGDHALQPSGKLYRIDTAKSREAAVSSTKKTALKALWLEKRKEQMLYRKGGVRN